MIRVKNLVKTFSSGAGEVTVLKNLSFDIPSGQFIALTGKSGAGKSTTLYQLSLLDKSTSGEIIVDDEEISLLSDSERVLYRRNNFGFIFQDYALIPTLTTLENVLLPLIMMGEEREKAEKKAVLALESVELGERLYNLPNQLSGGQQQRVSIARSIVHTPKVLFADEPTANLDSESSKVVLDIFLKLNKEKKLTVVMVTHERDYAKIADRNIELSDGKIISDKIRSHK